MADTRFRLIAFVLGLFAGWSSAHAQPLVESAQKEGEVVVYGASLNDTMDPMHRAFEKKYGVESVIQAASGREK
jgi:hypothetical protein